VGEIVLVVIGILIALQINNNNDQHKLRAIELRYLQNIKSDAIVNIGEMRKFIKVRKDTIAAANRILKYFEGEPVTNYSAFNADGMMIYNWEKFYQNDNTFKELINSGNLALLNNETIKKHLLDIEAVYKKLKSEEAHYRFDTEKNIYEPVYKLMDLNPMVNDFMYQISEGKQGKTGVLSSEYYADFFESTLLKNGFILTILEFNKMNEQMTEMITISDKLIVLIDIELAKG
jgi:hypothetical protein